MFFLFRGGDFFKIECLPAEASAQAGAETGCSCYNFSMFLLEQKKEQIGIKTFLENT